MAINSRSKGQRGEREVRDLIQIIVDDVATEKNLLFAPEIKRNLVQSREGGHDLVGIPGLAVEVKFQENIQVGKWWEQTLRQAKTEKARPVLIYRRKHQPWRVVMIGALVLGDNTLPATVTIEIETFRDWLREYLLLYLV